MKILAPVLALAVGAAGATAQVKNVDLPLSVPFPAANNYPFAGPILRYQQWYSGLDLKSTVKHPVRVQALWFQATTPGGQAGKTVDLEVRLAHMPVGQPTATFDSNLQKDVVIVVPRRTITLGTATPGSFPVQLTLVNEFVWDGESGVILEVRVHGNGNGNQAYPFDLLSTSTSVNSTTRLYTVNNALATTAQQYQSGWGLVTRFVYREGTSAGYGQGCGGTGGVVPVGGTVGGYPVPANANWGQRLTSVPPNLAASVILGSSRTTWGGTPLPFELLVLNAPGCFLLAEPLVILSGTTISIGPGVGALTIPTPIPPVTSFVGGEMFHQWLVLDPGSANGALSVSNGVWTVFGQ
ncbi:MAG: hypothetical protein IT458_14590 [Planctomycetes bacterium]|nr:hypothetical protein [Planctomycetota bacterium]